ncbi:MAG: sigma 54-interacting transcriptional regulator [Candidatus Marinimicrobia bacterium]|nr:sigma 54-interacting transcriptional regulator [Candidatus Neomarinimicrobiota bacterium]
MNKINIYIFTDNSTKFSKWQKSLQNHDFRIEIFNDSDQFIQLVKSKKMDFVIIDTNKNQNKTRKMLTRIRDINPQTYTIFISNHPNIEDSVRVMKAGASDYISHPIDTEEIKNKIEKLSNQQRVVEKNISFHSKLRKANPNIKIVHKSPAMQKFIDSIKRNSESNYPILLQGEKGTRKELLARTIHLLSAKKDKSFLSIDCTNYQNILQNQPTFLYKHLNSNQRATNFNPECDQYGTIYFDNIDKLPAKTLHHFYEQLSSQGLINSNLTQEYNTNPRIISSINKNLDKILKNDKSLANLIYQINTITLRIPPLRARKPDIPEYVNHFIKKYCSILSKKRKIISSTALDKLIRYSFPGNLAELENIIERAVTLSQTELIISDDIVFNSMTGNKLQEDVQSYERRLIKNALEETAYQYKEAANKLGISFSLLQNKINKYFKFELNL